LKISRAGNFATCGRFGTSCHFCTRNQRFCAQIQALFAAEIIWQITGVAKNRVGAAVREILAITNARFGSDSDFTSIAKLIEDWAGVQIRG
jgi:hypothetical protein